MARSTRGRRFEWFAVDTGVLTQIGRGVLGSDTQVDEFVPVLGGRSVFSASRPAADSAVQSPAGASAASAERGVHRSFLDRAVDGTITRIVGEFLCFPSAPGTGANIGRYDAGMILLPPGVFDSSGNITGLTTPNPSAFDQPDFFMHTSGWVDYTAEGAQTPFIRHIDQKARRIIDGSAIPAFCVNFEGDETASVRFGFRGRLLVLKS